MAIPHQQAPLSETSDDYSNVTEVEYVRSGDIIRSEPKPHQPGVPPPTPPAPSRDTLCSCFYQAGAPADSRQPARALAQSAAARDAPAGAFSPAPGRVQRAMVAMLTLVGLHRWWATALVVLVTSTTSLPLSWWTAPRATASAPSW